MDTKEKKPFSWSSVFIVLKYTAFAIFTVVSFLLSLNMFQQLSNEFVEKVILTAITVALEGFKIFCLVRGNTLLKLKLKKAARRSYALYGTLALLAILAAYGTTRTIIERSAVTASTNTYVLKLANKQAEIDRTVASQDRLLKEVTSLTTKRDNLPPTYISSYNDMTKTITQKSNEADTDDKTLTGLRSDLTALQVKAAASNNVTRSTVGMFPLMAKDFFNMPVNLLTMFLLLLISVLIELGIISTSPTIPVDKKHLGHFLDEFTHEAEATPEPEAVVPVVPEAPRPKKVKRVRELVPSEPQVPVPQETPSPEYQEPSVTAVPDETPEPTAPEEAEGEPQADPVVQEAPVVDTPAPKVRPRAQPDAEVASVVVNKTHEPTDSRVVSNEPTKLFRFGKTTDGVKNLFISFTKALFKSGEGNSDKATEIAETLAIKPGMAAVFIGRLTSLKTPDGDNLVLRQGSLLSPRFPLQYIIDYATEEVV